MAMSTMLVLSLKITYYGVTLWNKGAKTTYKDTMSEGDDGEEEERPGAHGNCGAPPRASAFSK